MSNIYLTWPPSVVVWTGSGYGIRIWVVGSSELIVLATQVTSYRGDLGITTCKNVSRTLPGGRRTRTR